MILIFWWRIRWCFGWLEAVSSRIFWFLGFFLLLMSDDYEEKEMLINALQS
jgi:hypothetical protein